MIELFKHLAIPMDVQTFDVFKTKLRTRIAPPWVFKSERLLDFVVGGKSLSFTRESGDLRDADLSLAWHSDEVTIGNIVPRVLGQFSISEYNSLLDEFHDQFIRPVVLEMHLSYQLSAGLHDISDWLSAEAQKKLLAFSRLANKGTGSSHPADHERWLDFIIQAHLDSARMPSSFLQRWLMQEQNWPETIAMELVSEFERGTELLQRYEAVQ